MTQIRDWERLWAPYDEATYQEALAFVRRDDVVLDIGAGDLRLARRLAQRVRRVYALERNETLFTTAVPLPPNLHLICADATRVPFPEDVTTAVLLMRHCRHLDLYIEKCRAVGCRRLITNARWGMGVEKINLWQPRRPYAAHLMGWYACRCGGAGFVPGPPEQLTLALATAVVEVDNCPQCAPPATSNNDGPRLHTTTSKPPDRSHKRKS